MITDKDRSYWIGASDTAMVVGNWNTKTFKAWFMKKLGINKDSFTTKAMNCGTYNEHKILETIPGIKTDEQVIIPEYGLRVNYDGRKDKHIYEVKTTSKEFKVTKAYYGQAQVEMYAWYKFYGVLPSLSFLVYQVNEDDYANYFLEIDKARLSEISIEYDQKFIDGYLPKLTYLHKCIEEGRMPNA